MDKPFAITLDVGSTLANKTGSWRTERPEYVHRMPPCNHACPAGENIQAWLYEAEEGKYEQAWRKIMEDNPFPAIMGRVCYHPCETACNRGQLDESVGINSVERFLGDEAIKQGWTLGSPLPSAPASACSWWAPGPRGCRPPTTCPCSGTRSTIRDAGPKAGGMMRFGIPAYRLPARRARCRGTAHPRHGREAGAEHARSKTSRSRCARAASTPRSSRWAPTSASAPTSRPAPRPNRSTPSRCCAPWRARSARCSAGGWWSMAAATPRWMSPAPPGGSAPRRRSWSTGAHASACPRTTSRWRRPSRRAC